MYSLASRTMTFFFFILEKIFYDDIDLKNVTLDLKNMIAAFFKGGGGNKINV